MKKPTLLEIVINLLMSNKLFNYLNSLNIKTILKNKEPLFYSSNFPKHFLQKRNSFFPTFYFLLFFQLVRMHLLSFQFRLHQGLMAEALKLKGDIVIIGNSIVTEI